MIVIFEVKTDGDRNTIVDWWEKPWSGFGGFERFQELFLVYGLVLQFSRKLDELLIFIFSYISNFKR